MITARLSRLQKRILYWLAADHHRTKGVILSSHVRLGGEPSCGHARWTRCKNITARRRGL